MSEDLDKLQRLLEQATAAEGTSKDDLDPEAASLREAWIRFGQLLETAQPATYYSPLLTNLRSVPGEGQGVRAVRSRVRSHRRLLSAAALLAASLLIGVLTIWTPRETDQSKNPSPAQQQTAAIKAGDATLVQQNHPTAPTANEPQWDDSLDEQVARLGQRVASAKQNQFAGTDDFASMQYRIEQFRQEVQADPL
jgi:hypothetical protein